MSGWLPVLVWLAVVSAFSTEAFSDTNTRTWLALLLNKISPGWPSQHPHLFAVLHHFVRKAAHFTEYALLSVLIWRAVIVTWRRASPAYASSFAACFLYAVLDEVHQSFVGTRTPSRTDVGIDMVGAVAGLLVVALVRLMIASSVERRTTQVD
ncbi:MAG: VanZ family protein [Armatimonadota bacterium]